MKNNFLVAALLAIALTACGKNEAPIAAAPAVAPATAPAAAPAAPTSAAAPAVSAADREAAANPLGAANKVENPACSTC